IFKPSDSSWRRGILVSTPETFEAVADRATRSRWERYVVQEFVEDQVLYKGRKFNLRIYALVSSFDPLRFRLYRDGPVGLAVRKLNQSVIGDPLRDLPALRLPKDRGISVEYITITELLQELE